MISRPLRGVQRSSRSDSALKLNGRQILDVLWLAPREQAMTMVHRENRDLILWLTERLETLGRSAPKYHAVSRPSAGEGEATQRAVGYAELRRARLEFTAVAPVSGGV